MSLPLAHRGGLALLGWALVALGATLGAAQDAAILPVTLPLDVTGLVHRTVELGCGQAWDTHEAWSRTALEISRSGRARLSVDARVTDESGGVAGLLGGGPYHDLEQHHRGIEWTGRARRVDGGLVLALRALTETTTVAGIEVTNRSTLAVTVSCAHEMRDVFAATRPPVLHGEPPTGRRALLSCVFEPLPSEGPLPRPVAELLTTPFLLDAGAGVTTDAAYDGSVMAPAPYLVAREPGGFALP